MVKPVWSLRQIVSQLTNWEMRWDTNTPIAYAFYTQPYGFLGNPPNFSPFSVQQREALARHAELIADVANIRFVNVADNGQQPGYVNPRIAFFNINHVNAPFWGVAQDFVTDSDNPPYGRAYGATFDGQPLSGQRPGRLVDRRIEPAQADARAAAHARARSSRPL